MTHRTLEAWLDAQQAGHPKEIELGLARVAAVAARLGLDQSAVPTLIVGGTNGKGSTVALAAGLIGPRARVGCYTSPHLWRYNERIVVDDVALADDEIVAAFNAIAAVRGDTPLTYFEWGTLAALWLFARHAVDVRLLEVGLGGRLDAVNIVDADVAVVTSIGLDHTDWLGDTRDAIGYEKAGIYRAGRPALCGDRAPPAGLCAEARRIGAALRVIGADFDLDVVAAGRWRFRDAGGASGPTVRADDRVHRDNLAAAMAAVRHLGFPVEAEDVARAVAAQRRLPGRREMIDADIPILYDVGHNEQAIALLVETLQRAPVSGRTHLVIGMLSDKPVEAVGLALRAVVDAWYPAGLSHAGARGLDATTLAKRLDVAAPVHDDPVAALAAAHSAARRGDRIVVCGSFFTVARVRSPEQ